MGSVWLTYISLLCSNLLTPTSSAPKSCHISHAWPHLIPHATTHAFVIWSNSASIVENQNVCRSTGRTLSPSTTLNLPEGRGIYLAFGPWECDCIQAGNCGWFPNTEPWNQTYPMPKAVGSYHPLTCLQKRGGSQTCGSAAASMGPHTLLTNTEL